MSVNKIPEFGVRYERRLNSPPRFGTRYVKIENTTPRFGTRSYFEYIKQRYALRKAAKDSKDQDSKDQGSKDQGSQAGSSFCKCGECKCLLEISNDVSSQADEMKETAKEKSAFVPKKSYSLKVSNDMSNLSLNKTAFEPMKGCMPKSSKKFERSLDNINSKKDSVNAASSYSYTKHQDAANAAKEKEEKSQKSLKRKSDFIKIVHYRKRSRPKVPRHPRCDRDDLLLVKRLIEKSIADLGSSSSSESSSCD